MKIHVDGDLLVYRCGFAAEKGEYILSTCGNYGDDEAYTYKKDLDARIANLGMIDGEYEVTFHRRPEPVENALHNVKSIMKGIAEQADELVVYLSGPTNFREGVAKQRVYKGNRDKAHKPVHGGAIIEYIKGKWDTIVSEDEEADDTIGIAHYALWERDPYISVIASTDKDLDMLPGLHYNFVKDESYFVDEPMALYTFYKQLITGDSVDNIVGVPKMGKVRAEQYLSSVIPAEKPLYDAVLKLYENAYKADARDLLIENARLIWIRRRPNEWWLPPGER